jgi:hypothetical protein
MLQTLKPHPDFSTSAVERVEAEVTRPKSSTLELRYVITGKIGDLRIPPGAMPKRADELWKHTCFEAFARAPGASAYHEFNFAPSAQWAAYHFDGYRAGMKQEDIAELNVETHNSPTQFTLNVTLTLAPLSDLPRDSAWQLALSAVIEEKNGKTSLWALAHAPGKPDFHNADCFVLELAPPS